MGGAASPGLLNSISSGLKAVLNGLFGADTKTLTTANLPAYTPSGTIANGAITINHNAASTSQFTGFSGGSGPALNGSAATISASQNASTFTGSPQGGSSTAFGITQPSRAVNFIIRIA
jgi:hypothetical protein